MSAPEYFIAETPFVFMSFDLKLSPDDIAFEVTFSWISSEVFTIPRSQTGGLPLFGQVAWMRGYEKPIHLTV